MILYFVGMWFISVKGRKLLKTIEKSTLNEDKYTGCLWSSKCAAEVQVRAGLHSQIAIELLHDMRWVRNTDKHIGIHSWVLVVHVKNRPVGKHRSLRMKTLSWSLKFLFPTWKIGMIIKNRFEMDFKTWLTRHGDRKECFQYCFWLTCESFASEGLFTSLLVCTLSGLDVNFAICCREYTDLYPSHLVIHNQWQDFLHWNCSNLKQVISH